MSTATPPGGKTQLFSLAGSVSEGSHQVAVPLAGVFATIEPTPTHDPDD